MCAPGQFLEGPEVQEGKALPDRRVGLFQAEESPLSEAGQDKTLGDQHPALHLGLVLGMADPGRNDGGAVMLRQFGSRCKNLFRPKCAIIPDR